MIFKSHNERQSYGPDKLVPPARPPASQPASQPDSPPAFANLITSFFLRKTWLIMSTIKCGQRTIACYHRFEDSVLLSMFIYTDKTS
jgi:hypothetical protein